MPKLSDEQTAQRRSRILDAAERCFSRDGFHGSTMQAICREAGISAGALYVYFASKEALIEGLTSRDRDEILAQFAQASGEGDFLGAVGALHSVLAVEVRDPREGELPDVGHLALVDPETGEQVEVDTRSRALRERFARIEAERRARVASELRRLQVQHVVLTTAGDWLRDFGRGVS